MADRRTPAGRVLLASSRRACQVAVAVPRAALGPLSGPSSVIARSLLPRRRSSKRPRGRLLDRSRAALVVIDVQEGFRPVMEGFGEAADAAAKLVQGARLLDVPTVVTEQYPQGLGSTVAEVSAHMESAGALPKLSFSAVAADGFDIGDRDQVIVCGMEAHLCVWQTVHALLEQGVDVHVPREAVSSRDGGNRELGLRRMERAGASVTSVEAALFELLRTASAREFKEVQALIK